MEFFPDGGFVRLQSRANRDYIHANGNWVGVSLRSLSRVPSLEAVWRVQHWVSGREHHYVLLQNAAYGRYLSFSPFKAKPGRRVIQRDFDEHNLVNAMLWTVHRVKPDQDYVRLRQFDFHLRANGRYLTGDHERRRRLTTMMQWRVHAVVATPLPLPQRVRPLWRLFWPLWRLFWTRRGYGPGVYKDVPRVIRHVRANNSGMFDPNHLNWSSFITHDQAVVDLRSCLGNLQDDWTGNMLDFTLCIQPGKHGRLMPLVTHLPRSTDPLNIVVFRTGSPGTAALVYPQIAPAP